MGVCWWSNWVNIFEERELVGWVSLVERKGKEV